MYVYPCRSIQSMLVTLKRNNSTIVFIFYIYKEMKQSWRKIANKLIKSWGQNTGWKEQLTIHFYCVIRIGLQSNQLWCRKWFRELHKKGMIQLATTLGGVPKPVKKNHPSGNYGTSYKYSKSVHRSQIIQLRLSVMISYCRR